MEVTYLALVFVDVNEQEVVSELDDVCDFIFCFQYPD